MKKYFLAFIFGLFLFSITSSISYSEICCMFSASRYYGWPYPYLVLNKTVETYEEAEHVKNDSISALMNTGWKLSFGNHMTKSLLRSPVLSMLSNLAISFATFFVLIFAFGKVKTTKIEKK
jgi:uncharacterized membrane protein YccF (DUF307 family)